jgi:hypothetical protein
MVHSIIVAVGIRENGTIKGLYTGPDMEAAEHAVHVAGEKLDIIEGRIFKNPLATRKISFAHLKTVAH